MRQWRVGTISMGFFLISLGILLLGNTFWDLSIEDIVVYGWPIILIILGIEVLLHSFFKKDGPLKFDFFSIFILILVLMFTFVVYSVQTTGILPAIRGVINEQSVTIDVNENLTIPASVTEVVVDSVNGNFNITGTETTTAQITGTLKVRSDSKEEAENSLTDYLTIKINGNQAIIRVEDINKTKWFDWGTTADLSIVLPKELYLKTDLLNGDTTITGMEKSGEVSGTNGKIVITDSIGDYTVDTMNGKITLKNIQGNVSAETINGEIYLENPEGELNAETTNGKIEIISETVNGDWKVSTVNGQISLTIPKDANASLVGKSTIGNVKGNVSWTSENSDQVVNIGSDKKAVLGSGEYSIELRNQNGAITVNVR